MAGAERPQGQTIELYNLTFTAIPDKGASMKRRSLLKAGAGCGVVSMAGLLAALGKSALAATVLRASDVHAPGYPTVTAVEDMGRRLEKFTGGRLSVQMFHSMTLGDEKETIRQTQIGAIQLVRVSVGALGPVVNDLNVLNLPFLFRNTSHMHRVIDSLIGRDLLDKVTAN